MNQKGFANILLIVLAVIVIGVAGYFALSNKSPVAEPMPPVSEPPITTPTPPNKAAVISVAIFPSASNLKRGNSVVISWQSTSAPSGSAVYLQLIPPKGGEYIESFIADGLSVNGSYRWHIPIPSDKVTIGGDYTLHGADIVDGKTYQIRTGLYIPTSEFCTERCPPSSGTQLSHIDSTSFTIEQP